MRTALVAAACLAWMVFASAASAATVSVDATGDVYTFSDASNFDDVLEIEHGTDGIGDYLEFNAFGDAITVASGADCSGSGTGIVQCIRTAATIAIVDFGGGADRLNFGSPGTEVVDGGAGDDILQGGQGDDVIDGGAGDDVLEEPDYIGCGAASGPNGADVLAGGSGYDKLDFICRDDFLNLTMDGIANDGAAGEGDDLAGDIEEIKGSSGPSGGINFLGNALPQKVNGSDAPANTIRGGGGNDLLYGGVNDDTVDGGPGNDIVEGYGGNDTVIGGPGEDKLAGEGGSAISDGAGGNDTIQAQDGQRDTVACGSFADRAFVDSIDVIAGGSYRDVCEEVFVKKAAVVAPAVVPSAATAIGLAAKSARVRRGRASVKVKCKRASACRGKLTLRRKTKSLGAARFTIAAGATKTIKVKLNKAGRKLLRRRKSAKVTASIKLNGITKPATAGLRLKRQEPQAGRG